MNKGARKDQEGSVQAVPQGLARLPEVWFWVLAFILVGGLRIPYLTSPNFIVDGDESIVGLMAKHLSEGREFAVFLYGQAYGFSLLETLPTALGFFLFGPHPAVLTLSMLLLFFLGLFFYERAFFCLTGDREWSRCLTLILALLPVWIVWSVKARGGYLSAFVLLGAVLWIFGRDRIKAKEVAFGGGFLALLAHAQAFWLPGALPFLLLPITRGHRPRYLIWASISAIIVGAGLFLLGGEGSAYWNPTVFSEPRPTQITSLPTSLQQMFSGFFYLRDIRNPPGLVAGIAWLLTAGYFLLLVAFPWALLRSRARVAGIMALSLLASVSFLPFLDTVPPRYLLSVSALLPVAAAIWFGVRGQRSGTLLRLSAHGVLLMLCLAAFQMPEFRPIHPETDSDLHEELQGLLSFFDQNGVEAVYSVNGLLQWQIMFYGGEEVPARYGSARDRYPAYPAKVDSIHQAGRRTVLVGPVSTGIEYAETPLADRMGWVGQDYFVIPNPPRSLLERLGFRFEDS